jgi:hypothetical protein
LLDTPQVYTYKLIYYYGGSEKPTFKIDSIADYAVPFSLQVTVTEAGTADEDPVAIVVGSDSKSISNAAFETAKKYLEEDLPFTVIMPFDAEDPVTFKLRALPYVLKNGGESEIELEFEFEEPLDEFMECDDSTGECEVWPFLDDHIGTFEVITVLSNSYGQEVEIDMIVLIMEDDKLLGKLDTLLDEDLDLSDFDEEGLFEDFDEFELDKFDKFGEDFDDLFEEIIDPEELMRLDEERQYANEEESLKAIDSFFESIDDEDGE